MRRALSPLRSVGRLLLVALLAGCGTSRLDLETLEELAWFKTSTSPTGAAFDVEAPDGRLAWVRDSYGLQVYRLNSGADAEVVASVKVEPSSPQARNFLAVKKGLVALGHGSRVVLFSYEEGEAPNPKQIAAFSSGGTGVGQLVFDGDWLYFASYEGGVKRVDVSTPSAPGAPESLSAANAKSLLLANGRLYTGGSEGLTILSLEGGTSRLGAVKLPTMSDLALYEGRWLYGSVGDVGDIAIIDVADPAAPRVVRQGYGAGQESKGMLLHGDQLIVPADTGQLKDYELSKPEEVNMRSIVTPVPRYSMGVTHAMALTEDFLLLAHEYGFFVFRRPS